MAAFINSNYNDWDFWTLPTIMRYFQKQKEDIMFQIWNLDYNGVIIHSLDVHKREVKSLEKGMDV